MSFAKQTAQFFCLLRSFFVFCAVFLSSAQFFCLLRIFFVFCADLDTS